MTLMRPVAGLVYWVDYRADAAMTATVNRVMSEASGMSGVLLGGTLNDPAVSVNNGGISYKNVSKRDKPLFVCSKDNDASNTPQIINPTPARGSRGTFLYDKDTPSPQNFY